MRLLKMVAFASTALMLIMSIPLRAQNGQERWGTDNCLYVAENGVWRTTQHCRTFPNPRNPYQWDLFDPQRALVYRFTIGASGSIVMYHYPSQSTFVAVNRGSVSEAIQQHIEAMRQAVAAAQQRRSQTAAAGPRVTGGANLGCVPGVPQEKIRNPPPADPACQTEAEKAKINQDAALGVATGMIQQGILDTRTRIGEQNSTKQNCEAEVNSGARDATGQGRHEAYDSSGRPLGPVCQ